MTRNPPNQQNMPPIWVIYNHPKDHPNYYVARRWDGMKATDDILKNKSLVKIRRDMESRGLVKLMRNDDDDPCIIESWI